MKLKNKKFITYVIITGCLLLIMMLIYFIVRKEKIEFVYSDEYVLGMELPSLLSFTYYDEEGWEKQLGEITERKLTYKDIENVLTLLSLSDYVAYDKKGEQKTIDREAFHIIYDQIVDILDVNQTVKTYDIIVLSEEDKNGMWLTQRGYREVTGCGEFFDKNDMFTVYGIDKKIIGVLGECKDSIIQKNIFVHKTEDGEASVFFQKEEMTLNISGLNESIENTICDLEWKENKIAAIYKKEDTIQGKVLSYNKKEIEIEGYGTLKHKGNLNIYKTYGTVEQLDESKLVIGNLVADFVIARKEVCGIILREPASIESIRVLILNADQPLYEDTVLTADETFYVTLNDEKNVFPANTPIKASEYLKDDAKGHMRLETETENGRIFFINENQEKTSLDYRGTFEIRKHENGFGVVNELTLEEYLYGVVPSEMPASYEIEALRVQAVCARSYACIQLLGGGYAEYGAHVDDSTSYQVYNKQPENEKTNLAVQDTVGEVIKYKDSIAEAYYFSTSCGYTESIGVWNVESIDSYGYLQSESLLTDESTSDMSDEETFAEFIKNTEIEAFDSEGVYFRWKAQLNLTDHAEGIVLSATERREANPDSENVLFYNKEGSQTVESTEGFGKIETISVEKRSEGGSINKLRINFENGSILIANEYNIRKILGAAITSMTDKDNNEIDSIPLLPSAYFTAVPVEAGYALFGGGYGHGIGMSQNGANGMAKAGYSYTDILLKFYSDVSIENIYNDNT